MYCPECGHQNPLGNRFCGMCGERLPERAAKLEKRPTTAEMRAEDIVRATEPRDDSALAAERRERIAEHDPEPVAANLRHREPVDETVRESEMPAAVADFYSRGSDEEPTTVSGPSFLGLSGGTGGSSSYSYLYEDEQPRSHAGTPHGRRRPRGSGRRGRMRNRRARRGAAPPWRGVADVAQR